MKLTALLPLAFLAFLVTCANGVAVEEDYEDALAIEEDYEDSDELQENFLEDNRFLKGKKNKKVCDALLVLFRLSPS